MTRSTKADFNLLIFAGLKLLNRFCKLSLHFLISQINLTWNKYHTHCIYTSPKHIYPNWTPFWQLRRCDKWIWELRSIKSINDIKLRDVSKRQTVFRKTIVVKQTITSRFLLVATCWHMIRRYILRLLASHLLSLPDKFPGGHLKLSQQRAEGESELLNHRDCTVSLKGTVQHTWHSWMYRDMQRSRWGELTLG